MRILGNSVNNMGMELEMTFQKVIKKEVEKTFLKTLWSEKRKYQKYNIHDYHRKKENN